MIINKGHREGLNQTYVAKSWPRVIVNGFYPKKDAKDHRIPTERVCEKMACWYVNHSEVQLRDASLNRERNKWCEEPYKEMKHPEREKDQESALTPAKPESNPWWPLTKVQAYRSFPKHSHLLSPPSKNPVWSETVQISIWEGEEDKLGK